MQAIFKADLQDDLLKIDANRGCFAVEVVDKQEAANAEFKETDLDDRRQ